MLSRLRRLRAPSIALAALLPVLLTVSLATLTAPAALAAPAVKLTVDWPKFLAQHDLVWKQAPRRWEEGAFLGNGLLGAMIFANGEQGLTWQLGRSDVTDHRKGTEPILGRPRLPIGKLRLATTGAVTGANARLSLWDAELGGEITTDRGKIGLRSFIHATLPVLIVEITPAASEAASRFVFEPALPINERLLARKMPITEADLHPAPFATQERGVNVSVQRRTSGGEYAVAWQERRLPGGTRLLALSIANSYPGHGARSEAATAVAQALAEGTPGLRRSHRAFWHAYYPQSFVSVPHPRIESFYWLQMYKLAAATRADRPAIDTMGPWYDRTPWPGVWWNLNIQLSYWPVYTANRLALGESMLAIVDKNQENLRNNVPQALRKDAMAVGRMGGPDAVSPVEYTGPRGPKNGAHEITNLVWVMHNYWLHWRHGMDPEVLTRLYPLLKASVNYVLARLTLGPDGKYHLPNAVSPEFPKTAPDTNYDLSLLRWGCETLLALGKRMGIEDPLAPKWRDTLARLTPYPVGPTGYLIGAGQPLDESHRHFSHLMMVYPLRLETGTTPAGRALIERSLAHWIGFEGALQGYSFVGASAISSLLGKSDDAARFLDDLLTRFVKPNTMYIEAGPVIETPLAAAQALHDMILQSWGDVIRVFPATPASWSEAAFHDLRAEGAFLVSAIRRAGRTSFVRVESLAGEPVTLRADIVEPVVKSSAAKARAEAVGNGTWKLTLAKGEWVTIAARQAAPRAADASSAIVTPVARAANAANPFGLAAPAP